MKKSRPILRALALLLAASLLLALAACGGSPAGQDQELSSITEPDPTPEATPSPTPKPTPSPTPSPTPEPTPDPEELALKAYRDIVTSAASYDFDSAGDPTGYQYALVQMSASDTVKTLLVKQQTSAYIGYTRVFQYDPGTGTVIQPTEALPDGAASAGGFRGAIALEPDGEGLQLLEMSAGTGATSIYRVTIKDGALNTEVQWEGRMDMIPEDLNAEQITWYETSDLSPLGAEDTGAGTQSGGGEAAGALPVDEGRIVFRGTLKLYSDTELADLQEIPEDQRQWLLDGGSYWIIVPETPQEMELASSGDPSAGLHAGTVEMICIWDRDDLDQYAGQPLIFSIDPQNTRWPSDASLPLGQPRTSDLHILS